MNHNYGVLSLGTVTTKHYLKKKLLSLLGIKKKIQGHFMVHKLNFSLNIKYK